MAPFAIPFILAGFAALAATLACNRDQHGPKPDGTGSPIPENKGGAEKKTPAEPSAGYSAQNLQEALRDIQVFPENPSIDGRYVALGETELWNRVTGEYLNKFHPLPEGTIKQKLTQAGSMWLNGEPPEPLTPGESQKLLQHLEEGLKTLKDSSPYRSLLTWTLEDLRLAVKNKNGTFPFTREYGKTDGFSHYDHHPEVKKLFGKYFPKISDPFKTLDGHVVEYSYANKNPEAPFVFIVMDAHKPEYQLKISETVKKLVAQGFSNLFSESTPYHPNDSIPLKQQIYIGGHLYFRGGKNQEILAQWRTPRASEALAFYFGDELKVFGSEDPQLYQNFHLYADKELEAYVPRLHERSVAMAENISKKISKDKIQKSVFIMGGAHTDGVIGALSGKNINWLVFVPEETFHPRMMADYRRIYSGK